MSQQTSRTDRAYQMLADDLIHGRWPPGAAISVKENAARLKVSATPIREALERLVGEGLVAVSGDRSGFVVPRAGLHGYHSLLDTFTLLLQNVASSVAGTIAFDEPVIDPHDAIATARTAFDPLLAAGSNGVSTWLAARLGSILSPYWSVEPMVIPGWSTDMAALIRDLGDGRYTYAIRRYARVRRTHAAQIVDRAERGAASIANISPI